MNNLNVYVKSYEKQNKKTRQCRFASCLFLLFNILHILNLYMDINAFLDFRLLNRVTVVYKPVIFVRIILIKLYHVSILQLLRYLFRYL